MKLNKHIIVKAPERLYGAEIFDIERTVFLAGSISDASDWQAESAEKLVNNFTVFNPRREHFDMEDIKMEREQIEWEHMYLNISTIIAFYFSHETTAPITLFEYGKHLVRMKYEPWRKCYVAIHPKYPRKNDVLIQTDLSNPELVGNICYGLNDMLNTIIREKG